MSPEVDGTMAGRVLQDSPPSYRPSWGTLSRCFLNDLPKFAFRGGWRAARRLSSVPGARPSGRRQIQVPNSPENPGQFTDCARECNCVHPLPV